MAMSRFFGGMSVTSRSPMSNRPPLIGSSPAIMLSVVVLPQPDGPTSTTNDPSAISRLRLRDDDMRAETLLNVDKGNVGHGLFPSPCRFSP